MPFKIRNINWRETEKENVNFLRTEFGSALNQTMAHAKGGKTTGLARQRGDSRERKVKRTKKISNSCSKEREKTTEDELDLTLGLLGFC